MNRVSYSVGPFIRVTEHSSLAQINIALVNGIVKLSSADDWETLGRLRLSYRELNDHLWLHLADLGVDAVKKNSFLTHYLNSSLEEIVRSHVWLYRAMEKLPEIEAGNSRSAREQDAHVSFRKEIRKVILWQTTGVYSRIIPAMFEHKQLGYLDDTLELQSLFAFWCIDLDMQDSALSASKRIVDACKQLLPTDAYRSARQSILIAQVGIYALARDADRIVTGALNEYRDFRAQFKERYPDLRFVGDFESAEDDLLEGRDLLVDSHAQQFRSVVAREHIDLFFRLLDSSAD